MSYIFFDKDLLMVAPLVSSDAASRAGHLGERVWLFARPVDDVELVAAVRDAWDLEQERSMIPMEDLEATWDPVRAAFGNERYSETNYALVNRIDHVGRRRTTQLVSVAATRWRNGNRDYGVQEGRSELGLDCSDEELAVAIRAAIAATTGPR